MKKFLCEVGPIIIIAILLVSGFVSLIFYMQNGEIGNYSYQKEKEMGQECEATNEKIKEAMSDGKIVSHEYQDIRKFHRKEMYRLEQEKLKKELSN